MSVRGKGGAFIAREVEKRRDDILQTLQSIVRIPSVVGQEGNAQNYMTQLFKSMGLDVHTFEAEKKELRCHENYVEVPWDYKGRPNVIGLLQGSENANSIVLNGHIDVVSPEPISSWQYDPWGAEIVGNKLYGRGSADMKGGLIAATWAVKTLIEIGMKPKGHVLLQSVIEEEAGGGGGTLATFMKGFRGDGVIIPEPQAKLTLAHAGVKYFRVKVKGKTSHAGTAHMGVNAISKMNIIVDALFNLDAERAGRLRYPLFEKGSGRSCHINIGKYHAGDWPSTVAGWAEMECRLSFIPGETPEAIVSIIEETISEAANKDEWLKEHPPEVEWFGWNCSPWEQDLNHAFIQMFKRNAEQVLEKQVEIIGKAAGLDTRFAKLYGMPALTFGPDGENIHGIDEFVFVDSVIDCTKIIALSVLDWCGVQG